MAGIVKRHLLATLLVAASLVAQTNAQTSQLVYSQNFNSAANDATGTSLNDGSNIVGSSAKVWYSTSWGSLPADQQLKALWLTPMESSRVGNFFMPDANPNQYVSAFSANFSVLVNYNRSLQTVADGFSLNFGKFNNTTSAYGGEAGVYSAGDGKTGDVLSFSFYTLTGAQKIEARYNGTTIASTPATIVVNNKTDGPPPNTAYLPVNISWDSNGVDLSYNGNTILSNVAIPGFNPGVGYKFAMAARTGSAFENLFVDDIAINTTVAPFVWSGGTGNWTTAGNWTVGTAPTTNNNWIVLAGAGGNANNNAVTAMQGLVFGSNATGSYVLSGNAFTIGADGIANNSTSTQTVSSNLTLGASQTFSANTGTLAFNGTINAGTNTLTVNGSNAVTINGALTGSGAFLTKSGSGNFTLGGTSAITKDTSVSAGTLQIGSGASLSNRMGSIASQAGESAAVNVNNGTWTNSSSLTIGTDGNGTLNLNGGSVSNTSGYIGYNATSVGVANVSAGTLSTTGALVVGNSGNGTLNLNGGTVSNTNSVLGWETNSTGAANVSGGNWTNNGIMIIGRFGNGTLNLTGGNVSNNAGTIGSANGISGVVSVGGGTWTNNGSLTVGLAGNGTLNITGGNVSNTFSRIGDQSNGVGVVTVSGGTWTNNGSISVGLSGNGTLNISGGTVNNGLTTIGGHASSTGVVNMSNGTWIHTGNLTIGSSGSATLNLTGGNLTNQSSTIGFGVVTAVANVSGGTWTNCGPMVVGSSGNGTLNLTGGTVSVGNGTGTLSLAVYGTSTSTLNIGNGTTAGTLQAGTVTGGGGTALVRFNHTGNHTLGSKLAGSLSVNKTGLGTTILSGNTTYTGTTTINSGTLEIASTGLLGGGNYSRAIVNNGTFIHGSNSNQILSGTISGSGGLVKKGNGTLTLSGANTYNGGTTILGGILATSGNERLADANSVTIGSVGRLRIGGIETIDSVSGAGSVNLQGHLTTGASSSSYAGEFAGWGTLTKSGQGSFTLTGASAHTGDTIVSGGTLVLANANALWSGGVVNLQSGGTITVNQRTFIGALDQNGGIVNGTGELVATLTATNNGSLDAVIADGPDFAAGILKRTSGTTTIGAANTFTGAINLQGGTLQLAEGGSFSSASSLATSSGATMDLNNKSQTFSRISGAGGTVSLGTGNLTVNQSSESEFGGSITGSGGLTKSGAGNLTLTGASTYLGATTVSAGQLTVDGSIASNATIQSGARLTGSGRVGGLIINSGATVNPGNSPGALSVDGNAVWNAGSNYDWESLAINTDGGIQTAAGTDWDFMDISGTLTLGGLSGATPFNLNLTSLSSSTSAGEIPDWDPNIGSTWLIARAASGIYLDSSLVGMNQNYSSFFNINTAGWSGGLPVGGFQVITLGSSTDLYLQAVNSAAIPEPGQVAASILLLIGISGYVWHKRRKEAKAKAAADTA
jgi:fibronectin-binding autotransporter adhesin